MRWVGSILEISPAETKYVIEVGRKKGTFFSGFRILTEMLVYYFRSPH
jgi:hypothetical protein